MGDAGWGHGRDRGYRVRTRVRKWGIEGRVLVGKEGKGCRVGARQGQEMQVGDCRIGTWQAPGVWDGDVVGTGNAECGLHDGNVEGMGGALWGDGRDQGCRMRDKEWR